MATAKRLLANLARRWLAHKVPTQLQQSLISDGCFVKKRKRDGVPHNPVVKVLVERPPHHRQHRSERGDPDGETPPAVRQAAVRDQQKRQDPAQPAGLPPGGATATIRGEPAGTG